VVDAILSGTHENGSSHHELLRAFVPPALLIQIDEQLETGGYRTHEFGDSVWFERRSKMFTASTRQ
jgi:S-adenosylmethionine:tRNA ribosyltransferase-isomerase